VSNTLSISTLMNIYRNSRLHNARNGKFLARLLYIYNRMRNTPNQIKIIDGINFELDLNEIIDSSLFYSNTFEPKNEILINDSVKPGMVVFDIGANIGYHTFRFAQKVGRDGIVYAIEPTSWAIKKLTRNLQLNPLIQNIKLFQIAFSDTTTGIQNIQFQSSYRLDGKEQREIDNVLMISLDDFMDKFNVQKVDFIKLDVDGFEAKIFEGAQRTIIKFRPQILFEFNPWEISQLGSKPEIMLERFTELGYQLFDDNRDLYNLNSLTKKDFEPEQSQMLLAIA
jgi:FkbM family methyltransferase